MSSSVGWLLPKPAWTEAFQLVLYCFSAFLSSRAVRRLLSSGVQTRLSGLYPCEDFRLWSFLVAVFPPLELQFSPSGLFLSFCLMSASGSRRSQTATHRWLERKEVRKDGDPQSWWKDKVSCGHVFFFERGAQYKHSSTDDELNVSQCASKVSQCLFPLTTTSVRRIKVGKGWVAPFFNLPHRHMWLERGFKRIHMVKSSSKGSCWERSLPICECACWLLLSFFK